MDNREKILEATARVYAEFGYSGATTRRIADAAGVNEVTLFRRFGSKSALIEEALRFHMVSRRLPKLPDEPVDPVRELTTWCRDQIAQLKAARAMVRTFMCDMHQHPSMRSAIMTMPDFSDQSVYTYVDRLRELGLADADFDAVAAVQMLRGAIFGDVMGRDMVPNRLPQPEKNAPALYATLFLRAIGVDPDRSRSTLSEKSGREARRAPAGGGPAKKESAKTESAEKGSTKKDSAQPGAVKNDASVGAPTEERSTGERSAKRASPGGSSKGTAARGGRRGGGGTDSRS